MTRARLAKSPAELLIMSIPDRSGLGSLDEAMDQRRGLRVDPQRRMYGQSKPRVPSRIFG